MKQFLKHSFMSLWLVLFLSLLGGSFTLASAAGWVEGYGLSYSRLGISVPTEDAGFCINTTSDGGYIVVGTTTYDLLSGGGNWVIKLDSDGNVQWEKAYISSVSDRFVSVEQASDGSYYLGGFSISTSTGDNDFWVMKLDGSGNILWQKSLGDSQWNHGRYISITPDGGVLICGYTSQDSSDDQSNAAAQLVKLDSNGNLQWQKEYRNYSDSDNSTAAWSLQSLDDGGAIVAGGYTGNGFESGFAWLTRLDSSGNISWQKGLGHRSSLTTLTFRSVAVTSDGGYIAVGSAENQDEDSLDFFVARFDSGGGLVWQHILYDSTTKNTGLAVCQTTDGGYIVGGDINDGNSLGLVKLDGNGNIVWQRKWIISSEDSADITDLKATSDGGCVLVGTYVGTTMDVMVMKVDSDGNISSNCFNASLSSTSDFSTVDLDLEQRDTEAQTKDAGMTLRDTSASSADTSATRTCN